LFVFLQEMKQMHKAKSVCTSIGMYHLDQVKGQPTLRVVCQLVLTDVDSRDGWRYLDVDIDTICVHI